MVSDCPFSKLASIITLNNIHSPPLVAVVVDPIKLNRVTAVLTFPVDDTCTIAVITFAQLHFNQVTLQG
jgi:hypothetical protein